MFIALSIMFGLVAATLALTKGRSAWAWFVVGFVVGPFAFIVLALPDRTVRFGDHLLRSRRLPRRIAGRPSVRR